MEGLGTSSSASSTIIPTAHARSYLPQRFQARCRFASCFFAQTLEMARRRRESGRAATLCSLQSLARPVENLAKPATRSGVKPRPDVIGQDHLFLVWVAHSTLGKRWPGLDAIIIQSASRFRQNCIHWTTRVAVLAWPGRPWLVWLALAKHHKTVGLTARDVM